MEYSLIYGYSALVGSEPLNEPETESAPNFPSFFSVERFRVAPW